MRGYAAIALEDPKTPANVGSVLRAAHCYGAGLVVIGGHRFYKLGKIATDTQKAFRHIPTILTADFWDAIPYDCVPVAVDLIPDAKSLVNYHHPERAFYIFGAEDHTLGKKVLDKCRDKIMVPTRFCMNLAAAVNVILYDRLAKQIRGGHGEI